MNLQPQFFPFATHFEFGAQEFKSPATVGDTNGRNWNLKTFKKSSGKESCAREGRRGRENQGQHSDQSRLGSVGLMASEGRPVSPGRRTVFPDLKFSADVMADISGSNHLSCGFEVLKAGFIFGAFFKVATAKPEAFWWQRGTSARYLELFFGQFG